MLGLGFLIHAGCRTVVTDARVTRAPVTAPAPATDTLADALLELETEGVDRPELRSELSATIEQALELFRSHTSGNPESEAETAVRFFKAVDQALVDRGYIFPPHGLVELLHQALKARSLSETDFDLSLSLAENGRRAERITTIQASDGVFHMVDCDLASLIFLATAERLGLPVSMVWIPNHMFVRWSSPTLSLNWDPNMGCSYSDEHYITKSGITEDGRTLLGWLANMPRKRVISTWLCNVAHWHERHGRPATALATYRRALAADPDDFEVANSLAWFLATCEHASFRDPREAVTIAGRLVAISPRSAWIDTLAAARAELGDFAAAVETKRNSPRVGTTSTGGINADEPASDTDDAVRAYSRGMTYRQGVAAGIIYVPRNALPYDD